MCFLGENNFLTREILRVGVQKLKRGSYEHGGRSNTGRITCYGRGGAKYRKMLRFIDFWRIIKDDIIVLAFDVDRSRSALLSLVLYRTGLVTYVMLPEGYKIGEFLEFSKFYSSVVGNGRSGEIPRVELMLGSSITLNRIPRGVPIYNVELWPLRGAQLCRAGGVSAIVLSHRQNFAVIKLRSGWKLVISSKSRALVGVPQIVQKNFNQFLKAGVVRNRGYRPTVRGVAMNAVDHPHGGGRGKTSGGPVQRTPWGKPTKGKATVSGVKRAKAVNYMYR